MILFIKNIDIEGPGTLGTYLAKREVPFRVINLGAGEKLPESLDDVYAVVALGGPMNVYEEDKFPYLKAENHFIKEVLKREIPFMGLCLGSQLLAKTCNAKVGKSPTKEIGFFPVEFTEQASSDPLFKGLQRTIDVFQWHEDMFAIPDGATLLARSPGCPHQAFKVGRNAYGLQFHVEVTDKSITEWSDKYVRAHQECENMKARMLEEYYKKKERFDQVAERLYNNFLEIIKCYV